jgi:penicillin-binding protein 2
MSIDPSNDRRPPITPQMAIRVAGVGVVAFVLFGIVFFRLWYLQVLDGDKYLAQARDNRVRTERIQAPRGEIVDVNNFPLVDNRKATVVSLDPASIPAPMRSAIAEYGQKAGQRAAKPKGHQGPQVPVPAATGDLLHRYKRLGKVLVLTAKTINQRVVDSIVQVPYANIRVKTGVPAAQRDYILERHSEFPGVTVEQLNVRQYPKKDMAAQILGTVGQITQQQLTDKSYKGATGGTDVGQSGLEAQYDQVLRGTDGQYHIEVNAAGERRQATTAVQPKAGDQLKLTLDQGLQQAGESALQTMGGGLPGAFVAMNPNNGAIYAMGSIPTYDPRDAAPGRFSTKKAYDEKFINASTGFPLIDRADESAYPTGSIFKPITSLAALSSGVTTPETIFHDDTGCFQTGARKDIDVACNSGREHNGAINLVDALRVSADTYFYNVGKEMFAKPGQPLQTWARKLGITRKTGIDLPGEVKGTIPSPASFRAITRAELACRKRKHVPSCGYGSGDPDFRQGDNENFAVGQGGLQATPLQMAVAYSTIINSGRVPTPHLGLETQDSRGITQPLDFPSKRKIDIKPEWRDAIMEGLHQAANNEGGTSKTVFDDGWPRDRFPIFGKTGTAERFYGPLQIEQDQAWYVAYSYDKSNPDAKPIVVVCTIEKGGFGADTAAPAARLILSKWFGVHPKVVHGDSTDR